MARVGRFRAYGVCPVVRHGVMRVAAQLDPPVTVVPVDDVVSLPGDDVRHAGGAAVQVISAGVADQQYRPFAGVGECVGPVPFAQSTTRCLWSTY